ncbi:putative LRR containing protein, partial [Trachipleistophora hominis]
VLDAFDLTDFAEWLKLKFTKERSSFNLTSKKERNTSNKSIKSIDFDVYMDKNTEFNVFGLIIPNDKLCSQIDNNQNMEGQYYISTPLELLFLSYIKVISKFNPCYNLNLRLFIKEENSELTAKNINICRNVSINGIQKILLTRVRIADDQVVKITSEYNSLILEYCTGRFIVPGIQVGVKKYINLQNTTFIQFYRIEEDIYSCKMTGINFEDKLLVSHKIRIAQLENSVLYEDIGLEFKYGCEILHLFDTKGVIISPDNNFKKIILSSYYQNFPVYYLSYPVYEIIISSCTINHQILIFTDSTKRIRLYSVQLTGHSMVAIDHECEKIAIWKTTGRFVISNIIKTSPLRQAILNLRNGVFIFGSNFSKTQCSLLLEHVVIKRRTIVRENVHVLNLISVVIRRRAVLKINDDCEVLLIDSCKGNIDFSGCTNLRSLTIKNHKFIYHKGIYDNLLSLHLENVNINTTLRLGGNIKNVKLVGVTTRLFKSVQIDRNCEMVHVRNFVGSLDIPDLFIYSGKMFTRRMITIAYERMSDTFGGVMFFNDIYLKNDYEIPSNVESLILRNFMTNENARLKINESCKYLKLNVYQGYIDVSKMKSIKKVAFLKYLPIFGDNCWEFSDQCKYPVNKIGKKKINLPINIDNVIIERVNIQSNYSLVVNENCQNVAIIFSEGNFDLSRIKKLASLKLLIEKQGLINIQFPDLSNVTNLEVSFDSNEEYFNLLLSKCINAKKLVLYNVVCELHDWIENQSLLGYKEEMTPYELSELKSIVGAESRAYQCRLSYDLHRNFITHSRPIFDYNRQVIIRDLSIIAFSIDKESLKQLKRFFMLTRLSIVTRTIFAGLFDSLPFSLNDFSLMLIPCHVTVDLGIYAAEDIDSKKKNTKNINLVNLRLHGLFIVKMEQFLSFPDKVDVLEVMPLAMLSDKEIQVRKKMWVKKLIIMQMNSRTREIIRSDYALEEYYNHLLNVLSQYIDFSYLEEIKILDQDTEKLVDPRDYSTNR